ncbi:MAG: hypothetical protein QMD95_03945 [Candidatus Hodarchaeaceae archaeon]|nr:hypothetical protein [Candidatus Hodarchaeaceae archaeon]
MSPELKALFEPKSVVVLGASELMGEDSLYAMFFRFIVGNFSKFKGKVHIVDLSGKLEGSEKKPNRAPRDRDLAVVVLPKELLEKNLPKLLTRKVRALILVSGDLEKKQEEGLSNLVKRKKLLLLGPNAAMGVINTANGLMATAAREPIIRRGHLAIITQDSSIAAMMLDRVHFHNAGISKFACTGEGLGVDETDLLEYLVRDKETNAICICINSLKNGRRFVEVIRETVKEKPVMVLKASPRLEGVFEAALRQAGALLTENIGELIPIAEGLIKQPPMRGNRIAIATNFPGQAILAARYLSEAGLEIATPSNETAKKITKKYPSVRIKGFVDLGATAKASHYKFVIEQLLSDEGVAGVMVINAIRSSLLESEDLCEIAEVAKKSNDKPVIDVVTCDEDYAIAREILADTKLPAYDRIENGARALKMHNLRWKMLEKLKQK